MEMLIKLLWILFAILFPFFGIPYWRPMFGNFQIPFPFFPLITIIFLKIIQWIITPHKIKKSVFFTKYTGLIVMVFAFYLIHLLSILQVYDTSEAINEFIKVSIGVLVFWSYILFFPRDYKFNEKIMIVILSSMAILQVVFIYKYAFIFHSAYQGVGMDTASKDFKNVIAWVLAILLPYAFMYWSAHPKNIFAASIVGSLSFAVIYIASRSAWLSAAIGLIYCAFFAIRYYGIRGFLWSLIFLIVISAVFGIAMYVLSAFVDTNEIMSRFNRLQSIISLHPHVRSEDTIRIQLLQDAIQQFWLSPFLGIGLRNTVAYLMLLVHNDYIGILLELGFFGEFFFLGMLFVVWRLINPTALEVKRGVSWMMYGTNGAFITFAVSLFFINIYASVHFWIYLAIFIVTADIEKSRIPEMRGLRLMRAGVG